MNDFASILGAGLIMILLVIVVCLLVATLIFKTVTKWVIQQDVSFCMSLAIVVLGIVASIGVNLPVSFIMAVMDLPEIAVSIFGFIISFCATSCVYFLMLKTNFWKASLIQILSLVIFLILLFGLTLAIGFIIGNL